MVLCGYMTIIYKPRYYQTEAHNAAIEFIKKSTDPCLIEAETGSGKSLMIAMIADTFYKISGKHVLCTAPSVELVSQNREKFLATGNKASIFSASIGKSLRWPVVFGTPVSIANEVNRFGDKFGLIIIDECHGITNTIKKIIESIREKNKNLRVIGLSATPYRLGTGFVYELDEAGNPVPESQCKDPYFRQKIYSIGGRELIEQGFLTQPVIGAIHGDHYDTINMRINSMGKFYQEDINKAYVGQNRKTANIIADIVAQSQYRRGTMIFAATVEHAKECMESLPPELSRMIGGDINTRKNERRKLVEDFKAMKFLYLVSVGTMNVGVDFTHVDVIALLRATESIGLLKQCIGRGLRLHEGKKDILILDYGENIARHCGNDSDIFNPEIKAFGSGSGSAEITAICPLCSTENVFSARKNEEGYQIDNEGYFVDLMGNRIVTEHGDMPSHYGRRCYGQSLQRGVFVRCGYFWTHKVCPECGEKADISARYCPNKHELINPNDKLIADFRAMKKDPTRMQCDKVLSWSHHKTLSAAGNEVLKVDLITEYRSFSTWFQVRSSKTYFIKQYESLINATQGLELMPLSVTYKKNIKTSFFEVYAWNQEADKL